MITNSSEGELPGSKHFPCKFFKTVFNGHLLKRGLELELRCIHYDSDNPVVRRFYASLKEFKKAWPDIVKLNQKGYNVFFGVVARDPKNEHKLVQPPLLTCLWADIDVGPGKPNKNLKRALKSLRRFETKPTIIVKSGHGLHVYYCLKKPTRLEPAFAKKILRKLAKVIRADTQAAEVARLLRVPNTVNWKGDAK